MAGSIDEGFWPAPTLAVQNSLKQHGGWSKYFARSVETRDSEDIIRRQGDQDFYRMYAIARGEEQLAEEVKSCIRKFKKIYPDKFKKLGKEELSRRLKKALLQEGWEPNDNLIRAEIAQLKKQEKEELSWLRKERKRLRERLRAKRLERKS